MRGRHSGLRVGKFLQHRFLLGLQASEGEALLAALLFFWPDFARCGGKKIPRSREEPQTALPHDGKGWRQILERGVPANGNLPHGISALVRGPTRLAHQRVAAVFVRQRILELFATPEEELQRSKTGTHDDSILLDTPYLVSWIVSVLKVLTEGHPDGHLVRVQSHTLAGTVSHQSETPGSERFGAVSHETLRDVHRPEQQIPKPPGGSETRKVVATSVHGTLRKTRETTSHCQSVLPAPRCISQSCTRPLRGRHPEPHKDRFLPPVRRKRPVRGPAVFWWELVWDVHVGSWVGSPFLGFGQIPDEPGRHPSLLATFVFKRMTAGNSLCVILAVSFLSLHISHKFTGKILKVLRVCDRNMLPWFFFGTSSHGTVFE